MQACTVHVHTGMNICSCKHVHICIHVCALWSCVRVCTHVHCVHICMCPCSCMFVWAHLCLCPCVIACACVSVHLHAFVPVHACRFWHALRVCMSVSAEAWKFETQPLPPHSEHRALLSPHSPPALCSGSCGPGADLTRPYQALYLLAKLRNVTALCSETETRSEELSGCGISGDEPAHLNGHNGIWDSLEKMGRNEGH